MSAKSVSFVYSKSMLDGKPPTEEEYIDLYAEFIAVLVAVKEVVVSPREMDAFPEDAALYIQKEVDGEGYTAYTVNSDLDKTLN